MRQVKDPQYLEWQGDLQWCSFCMAAPQEFRGFASEGIVYHRDITHMLSNVVHVCLPGRPHNWQLLHLQQDCSQLKPIF